MFSNLDNGDTLAIGQACMITFALSTAAELLEGLPADQLAQYEDLAGKIAIAVKFPPTDAAATPAAPARPRGRPRKPVTVTDENPATGDITDYDAATDAIIGEATA